MCLILLAYRRHPTLPLVVAANRDEFYARPTLDAHFWEDHPHILAGRDQEAGGTWLGVTRSGRFAAVTNFAEGAAAVDQGALLSRGELTQEFLAGTMTAQHYAGQLRGEAYRGYNLLLWDGVELVYASNRAATRVLEPGYHGLANASLGEQWPKVTLGTENLRDAMVHAGDSPDAAHEQQLLAVLGNRVVPPDELIPDTGRPLAMRRQTASCFIAGDEYGTRASTCLWIGTDQIRFSEYNFRPGGEPTTVGQHHWQLIPG